MIIANVLMALGVAVSQSSDTLLSADSALAGLSKGGFTIIWRHAATDQSNTDQPGFPNTQRFQQRNLSDRGVADAKAIGAIFKTLGTPIGEVLTSPMYRTRETAQYAFGRYTDEPLLISMQPSADERKLLLGIPAAGTNRVLVTHHFEIERNVPGIKPGDVAEGEAVVVRSNGEQLRLIAIIKMKDWIHLHDQGAATAGPTRAGSVAPGTAAYGAPYNAGASGAALVIPALLMTEQRAGVAAYLRAFNTGDVAGMRAFLERWTNPNPQRTMEQRLESFATLRAEMGTISIVSADAVGTNQVLVKVVGSTAKPATMTFTIDPSAPYKVSISLQVGGP